VTAIDSATFRKRRPGAPADYYAIEAAGLRWLAVPGGPPLPEVLTVGRDFLLLERLPPAGAAAGAAVDFGQRLATMHQAGASAYGSPPAGVTASSGYIADLTLPYGQWTSFGPFYAEARIEVYLDLVTERQALAAASRELFDDLLAALRRDDERLIGPAEQPSRLHGDLWSGNVLFSPGPVGAPALARGHEAPAPAWLIDPAAHGGHRETDLAMLALFGMDHLDDIIAGYQQVSPLAAGWRQRVALHQVHPLLVHAVLFGGGYLDQAGRAAARALSAMHG
jgi:fructosamine-3-kinase